MKKKEIEKFFTGEDRSIRLLSVEVIILMILKGSLVLYNHSRTAA